MTQQEVLGTGLRGPFDLAADTIEEAARSLKP